MEVPVELLEEIILGPDCHCYSHKRWDDQHLISCSWGKLQKLVAEEKEIQAIKKVPQQS